MIYYYRLKSKIFWAQDHLVPFAASPGAQVADVASETKQNDQINVPNLYIYKCTCSDDIPRRLLRVVNNYCKIPSCKTSFIFSS